MSMAVVALKDALNNALFNATAFSVANMYLSLHTADPGATGASEVTGGTYVRQAVPKVASSSGTYTNNANIDFTLMPACTVTHAGLWSASTTGTYYWGSALGASKATNAGDTFRVPTSSMTCTFA